jgi:hypothetical protein
VREIAVAEVEGRSPEPAITWSFWDAGEDKEDCRFAGSVSLGTTAGEDDNGMPGTTPRSALHFGSSALLDGGAKGG